MKIDCPYYTVEIDCPYYTVEIDCPYYTVKIDCPYYTVEIDCPYRTVYLVYTCGQYYRQGGGGIGEGRREREWGGGRRAENWKIV